MIRKKIGRPRTHKEKTQTVIINISLPLHKWIMDKALRNHSSMADVIRNLIQKDINEKEKAEGAKNVLQEEEAS